MTSLQQFMYIKLYQNMWRSMQLKKEADFSLRRENKFLFKRCSQTRVARAEQILNGE